MLREEKEFYDNGNLNYSMFIDENQKVQGLYKYYGGNEFVQQQYPNKNNEVYGVCESWLTSLRKRNWISSYKQGTPNGVYIKFNY